jgi:hypothetical protein
MSDGDDDYLPIVESVDDAEGKAMDHDPVMPAVHQRPPVRSGEDGLDRDVDRGHEAVAEPWPSLVVLVSGLVELRFRLTK